MLKVLIVEDSPHTLRELQEILIQEIPQIKVDSALSQADGMALLQEGVLH
jgi:DNA-binding LytR/AlgR family response regulator